MSTSFSFVSPRGRVLLDAESRCTHAHAMTAYLFESRPLQAESGGLDAARIRGPQADVDAADQAARLG
jgi:hypothetical protein